MMRKKKFMIIIKKKVLEISKPIGDRQRLRDDKG